MAFRGIVGVSWRKKSKPQNYVNYVSCPNRGVAIVTNRPYEAVEERTATMIVDWKEGFRGGGPDGLMSEETPCGRTRWRKVLLDRVEGPGTGGRCRER